VARIIGKIFGAMGILAKGHLVETDRSGLVAEFMGQTGPKTQAKINEALDGILFVDEAYSLVSQEGQDVFGSEAVQALLKRAEDDRARLVVILAGYPDEMESMLKSNPGLSSRFNRVLHFEDYSPTELARIFSWLCEKNHYKLIAEARAKLMIGLAGLHRIRDRHFGNGRAVRNLFEQAIRRMANRIVDIRKLSTDELMLLHGEDIEFDDLPPDLDLNPTDDGPWRFQITCPKCNHASKARGSFLSKKVTCPKCQHEFVAEWGEPVAVASK
jgi:SpoVK/Ycf46/Vps4 family AAA+-type ATPase